jgi:GGDEF domain-containing protein
MATSVMSTAPLPGTNGAPIKAAELTAEKKPVERGSAEHSLWLSDFTQAAGEETIVLDESAAAKHRNQMRILAKQAASLRSTAEFEAWSAMMRDQLHTYKVDAEKRFAQQKRDLDSAGTALRDAMETVAQQGEDQTKQVENELKTLESLRKIDRLEEIHQGIDHVSHSLADVVRGMQTQNSLVVAQMRDEIRTLQQRLELAERRGDGTPGNLSHRGLFERKLQAKIAADEVFSLFLIRVSNWKQSIAGMAQDKAQILTNDVSARISKVLGAETFAGRWYDGYFAAVVNADKRQAIDTTQEIVQKVSGNYKAPGSSHPLPLSVRVAVLEHYSGQTAEHLLRRVDELIRAFERT